jgi:hypothetical protein
MSMQVSVLIIMMHASVSGAQCIRSVWSVNGVSGSVSGGGVSEVA